MSAADVVEGYRGFEWLQSDEPEAITRRAALYLFSMLNNLQTHRRFIHTDLRPDGPAWPAILGYECDTDMQIWVEVKSTVHLRDWVRAFPDKLNIAAKKLINA